MAASRHMADGHSGGHSGPGPLARLVIIGILGFLAIAPWALVEVFVWRSVIVPSAQL